MTDLSRSNITKPANNIIKTFRSPTYGDELSMGMKMANRFNNSQGNRLLIGLHFVGLLP